MSAYEFLSPESFVAASLLDGSLIEDLNIEKPSTSGFGKIVKDVAAVARLSRRNASVGAMFTPNLALEV
jgi:hypothetical protein